MAEIGALAVKISADLGDLIDGFNRADKSVEKFSRQLDKRVMDPLVKITAAAGAAGAALFAFAKNAADTVDELGKLSQKVGINVEALSGLKFAAQLSDVSLDQLGQGLKQLSKFMVENKIEGVGVEEQLLRIADEFANAADSEQKTAAAMKLFGKAGADLIPLLNQGRAGIEELRKEAERLGVVFSTEAAKRAEEFNDNLTRLKATAQGVQVELAGPLVGALNDTAKAFLEAKQRGDGFFSTLSQIIRHMTSGSDLQTMQREMSGLGNALVDAQNELDEARRLAREVNPALAGQAEARVAAAAARVEKIAARMKTLQGILNDPHASPEAPGAPPGAPKTGTINVPDKSAADKAAKEAAEREQQVRDVMHEVRKADDARELEQVAVQNAALLAAQEEFNRQQLELQEMLREESDRVRREDILGQQEKLAREKAMNRERLAGSTQFFGNLASLMNTSSRRTFEIGKVAAIAEAGLRTTAAVIDAWGWGMKLFGPAGAAAAATAAGIAGLNYINNLRSQSFGGGGGAPTPSGQGSSGVAAASGAPAGGPEGGGGQTTLIKIEGDIFSADMVRKLLEKINTGTRKGGGRIVLV